MNWHHWYWWAAGFAIGVIAVCTVNWIRNEIGYRRSMAEFRVIRDHRKAHYDQAEGGPNPLDGAIARLKADGMYNPTGGPTYFERHGHKPDGPCSKFCRGNPAKLGGNGGAVTIDSRDNGGHEDGRS